MKNKNIDYRGELFKHQVHKLSQYLALQAPIIVSK